MAPLLFALHGAPTQAGAPTEGDPGWMGTGTNAVADQPERDGVALHTYLEASHPGEDEEVEGEVERVLFRFNTPVQLPFSAVTIRDATGGEVEHGEPRRAEDRGEEYFEVAFPTPLEPGTYTVDWQTAGPDDHVVRDSFSFLVVEPEATAPAAEPLEPAPQEAEPQATDPANEPMGVLVRWLFLVGIVGMMGAVTFRILIVPRLQGTEGLGRFGELATDRTRTAAWVFGALALVALPLRLWVQSASLFGPENALSPGNLGTVVVQSAWGTGFIVYLAAVVLFGVGLAIAGGAGSRGWGWALAALAALALPLAAGLSGHAWGAGEGRPLAMASIYVHVLSAGVWMGGLGLVLTVGLPALRAARKERQRDGTETSRDGGTLPGLGRLVASFSKVALVAVALLLVSGVVQAVVLAGAPWTLLGTGYGRTLFTKVGVAVAAFALGFYNWRVVRPALQERPSPGLLRIPATVEVLLGLAVLLVTAVLVTQALP